MAPAPILFCSHVVEWGGAETVLADLLTNLDRQQFTPHLACPGQGPLPTLARQIDVPVHELAIGGGSAWTKALSVPSAARSLRRIAQQIDGHVLVANTMIAGYAAVLAQTKALRCLWHLHIVTHSRFARTALRRAAAVVTPSRAGALAVDPGLAQSSRLSILPNGVADRYFVAAGTGLRDRLGIPALAPLLGIVGRVDPHKGHEVLLRALAQMKASPSPHLLVVGAEAFADSQGRVRGHLARLQQQVAAAGLAGRVHFLGHCDDPAPLLAQLQVVVVPSIALESAPRAVAEAQAAGKAVVASQIGGIGELIEHGTTGLLCPPGDAAALADCLDRLLGDPAASEQLGRLARERAIGHYRMTVFARRFEAVCNTLLGRVAPGARDGTDP